MTLEPDFSYEMVKTADGSPTVKLWKDNQVPEFMHHSAGALSESIYIYYHALEKAYGMGMPLHILSIGTGLGYNEMLTAAFAIRNNISSNQMEISTFESENFIRLEFAKWLSDQRGAWTPLYDEVALNIKNKLGVKTSEIKDFLQSIDIRPALTRNTQFPHKYTVIFFDFFSSKSTPDVWTPEALAAIIQGAADKQCVLSTYAAKGELKRALLAAGFNVEKRPGYSGKRDCTLAIRN